MTRYDPTFIFAAAVALSAVACKFSPHAVTGGPAEQRRASDVTKVRRSNLVAEVGVIDHAAYRLTAVGFAVAPGKVIEAYTPTGQLEKRLLALRTLYEPIIAAFNSDSYQSSPRLRDAVTSLFRSIRVARGIARSARMRNVRLFRS